MPIFGAKSLAVLDTIHPKLRAVLEVVILDTDFSAADGRRGKVRQHKAKVDKKSTKDWPDSTHNCPIPDDDLPRYEWPEDPDGLSMAVDITPYPLDWNDQRQFAYLAGRVVQEGVNQGVRIRWGGDWDEDGQGVWRDPDERFNDMAHHELVLD